MEDKKIQQIFDSIDSIMKEVDSARKEPEFSKVIEKRKESSPDRIQDDNDVLRGFARLIAYSQNAQSDLVSAMLKKNIFNDIFHNFEIDKVAEMDSSTVLTHHWDKIKVIRFPKKINSIIGCAESLASIKLRHGSFVALLKKIDIPVNLKSEADVEKFWQGFNNLRNELEQERMPFFNRHTSLLHFLLYIGYDCIKPDLVVMKVAKKLGIVESERGTKNLLQTVRIIQIYSFNREIRPSIVDFYFLIYGGQRDAKKYVNASFYERKRIY